MPVEVTPMAPGDEAGYSEFVAGCEQALLYHSAAYKAFLEALLGCRPRYQVAREAGRITGVLPLMEADGPLGRVLNSLPWFGSNGGVLATSESAREALVEHYNAMAAEPGVAAATLIANPLDSRSAEGIEGDLHDERIAQITPLPDGADAEAGLMRAIDASARRNVRKARREGVEVRVDNGAVEFLERVHRENMAEMGGNAKPHRFFELFPRHFAADTDYRIYRADVGGEPAAALLLFYFGETVEYYTPVTRGAARELQPMAAILMRAMCDAAGDGYRRWNWGGTWLSQQGVYRFKRKWGAEERRYRYLVRVNEPKLLRTTPARLLEAHPGFYVVPFDRLETA